MGRRCAAIHCCSTQSIVSACCLSARFAKAFRPAGERGRLQVSLGAADYTSSEELSHAIERADRAMYEEKAHRKQLAASVAAAAPT